MGTSSEFKNGLKILIDGQPYSIVESEFTKPGKGQAVIRTKMRSLVDGKVIGRTYKTGESPEIADVTEIKVQYLYSDGENWHFMEPDTYEQYPVAKKIIGDNTKWFKEQDICTMVLWNDAPLTVEPPNFVNLKVTETDPGLKGDTASGGTKPATFETGAVVQVPLFIEIGEVIKIDTRDGRYVSRAK